MCDASTTVESMDFDVVGSNEGGSLRMRDASDQVSYANGSGYVFGDKSSIGSHDERRILLLR